MYDSYLEICSLCHWALIALKAFSLNLDRVCRNASEVDQRELRSFFLMLLKVLNHQTHRYEREVCKAFL